MNGTRKRSGLQALATALIVIAHMVSSPPCVAQEARKPPEPMSDYDISQKYGTAFKNAVPALIDGLNSDQVSIRRNAAFTLGEIGPDASAAIKALARALQHDSDIEVRRNAAFALGEIGSGSIDVLMGYLAAKDPRIRRNVASALVRIGRPAIERLTTALNGSNTIARRNAAGILGRIGPPAREALPSLERHLTDPDKAFCWTVKQALTKIRQVSVASLRECLGETNPALRSGCAQSLGELGEKAAPAVDELIACLRDDSAKVRQQAAFALAKIGPAAVGPLCKALRNPDEQIRKNAAFSLGEMGPAAAGAAPELKLLLRDPGKEVRWCAANALSKINPSESADNATR